MTANPSSTPTCGSTPSTGFYHRDAFTGTTGNYTVEGLAPGDYFAIADHWQLDSQLYDGLPCPNGDCDPTTGTPIAASLNTTTPGIDFDLDYCTPTATSLCLGDRFRVEATWEDPRSSHRPRCR